MRWWRMACVALIIVRGAGLAPGRVPGAAAVGVWTTVASPPEVNRPSDRGDLTTLVDGRVLLTRYGERDGDRPAILTAALYDPATDRWTATPAPDPAAGVAAPVLLRDGTVLVSGGVRYLANDGAFGTAGAQRYDPAANRWTPTGALARPRTRHTATLLADGTVLVGGRQLAGVAGPSQGLAEAERYDPQTGQWSAAGALAEARSYHYATTPEETGYAMVLQEFAAGYLLTVDGPNERNVYTIYLQATGSHNANRIGTYARVAER